MAGLPNFIEGAAFGVLNDVLAGFRDNNGFAQPNRYEIIIIPPAKIGGGGNENIFNNQERQSDLRKISLRASTELSQDVIFQLLKKVTYMDLIVKS